MTAPRHLRGVALNYADGAAPHAVTIRDARPLTARLSLDRQGFELRPHATHVTHFDDPAEVRAVYYPEVEDLLRAVTGARRAVAFEHDVRLSRGARAATVRRPVPVVHDDYTRVSAPGRVRLYLADEAATLLARRYAVINVWRSIAGVVRESPLAVCDAETLAPADLRPTSEGVKHEVYLFRFRSRHRWYYFPAMDPGEALLLKCFDAAPEGAARFTAHTAFDDPLTPPDAPPRASIEVRALVFF
ncbi:MAG TPA: CmcJ/NvfI family oxidoreductase [Candidatus Binataceae bacterium]|nr:CmcJ/NvfI family oxidoreductase [Candidatus Binataceae bacterium]